MACRTTELKAFPKGWAAAWHNACSHSMRAVAGRNQAEANVKGQVRAGLFVVCNLRAVPGRVDSSLLSQLLLHQLHNLLPLGLCLSTGTWLGLGKSRYCCNCFVSCTCPQRLQVFTGLKASVCLR